jgi:hypothetical protein
MVAQRDFADRILALFGTRLARFRCAEFCAVALILNLSMPVQGSEPDGGATRSVLDRIERRIAKGRSTRIPLDMHCWC